MKYYLIAGERSGDLHGGNLIRSLKKHDLHAEFSGFGGDRMRDAGMVLHRHYHDMSFMGFWEVLTNLPKVLKYLKEAKASIASYQPDVVILIDYGGFNLKIASFLKKRAIRCYYYITPKVWAWNQRRAHKIKRLVDRMFVILPFEKEFYRGFNWDTDYVGNPIFDAVNSHQPSEIEIHHGHKPVVAFLPGSREQEIREVSAVVSAVISRNPQWHFIISVVDNVPQAVYNPLKSLDNVELRTDNPYDLLRYADAAIVTSGTATLETALLKVPQIVIYHTSRITYAIVRALIKVDYISLVNLVAGKEVVTELIQKDFNADKLHDEIHGLLYDKVLKSRILKGYHEVKEKLDTGSSASENTAGLMYDYLTRG